LQQKREGGGNRGNDDKIRREFVSYPVSTRTSLKKEKTMAKRVGSRGSASLPSL